jgi:NAD(P)H-binding
MRLSPCLLLILHRSFSLSWGFLLGPLSFPKSNNDIPQLLLQATTSNSGNKEAAVDDVIVASGSSSSSRRVFLDTTASSVLATSSFLAFLTTTSTTAFPAEAADITFTNDKSDDDARPFCIIGANGKTGTKCVQECLNRSFAVRATSRSGIYNDQDELVMNNKKNNDLLSAVTCNVKDDPSTIQAAIQGSRAVIFAASASKQGGTSNEVDNVGLVNVAKACLMANIPHLVIVSSGGVSKPESLTYQFLNRVAGGIMEEKIKGEDTVRTLYHEHQVQAATTAAAETNTTTTPTPPLTYTVIRPGGLTEEPARGVSALALNQGDTLSGRISRYDVASLCIAATLYPQYTSATTFECYDADTGKSLNNVGFSNIMKQTQTTTTTTDTKERERRGDTFEELFRGLEQDF